MRIEGLDASFSPSFEPLTNCPRTSIQRYRDILLLPPLLFQLPRSFPSFFSPIGGSPVLPYLLAYHTLLPFAEISKSEDGRINWLLEDDGRLTEIGLSGPKFTLSITNTRILRDFLIEYWEEIEKAYQAERLRVTGAPAQDVKQRKDVL